MDDGQQFWAFMIDLGNNNNGLQSPKNSASRTKKNSSEMAEMPWFKFSVMECCVNTDKD